MSESNPPADAGDETGVNPREERLALVYADCMDRLNAGERLDTQKIIREHPDLEPELGRALEGLGDGLAAGGDDLFIEEAPFPSRFGDFEIIRKLGRGGMGEVYLARQVSLDRLVALKVIAPSLAGNPRSAQRFLREAKAAGGIDHPSIISIYETGVFDGRPYFAMRYVEGNTIAEKIEAAKRAAPDAGSPSMVRLSKGMEETPDGDPEPEDGRDVSSGPASRSDILRLVQLVERAARALHVTHEAGFIHRDIKPSNIMVGKDGLPVILDFGLARLEDDSQALTVSGDILGTPAYMSPEQLGGRRHRIDRRTDIYSLGVTLYESLTLKRPFDAPTRESLYQLILTADPPSPLRLNRHIPKDLKVVLETAMEKNPDRRYQTAEAIAEDLRRVREYQPIQARAPGPLVRAQRLAQRNPVIATALVLLAAGLAVSLMLLLSVISERDAKGRALVRADGLRLVAQSSGFLESNPALALLLAIEGARLAPGLQASNACLAALLSNREQFDLTGHESAIEDIHFSPDGRKVLTASWDSTARLWDAATGRELLALRGHQGKVMSANFSPDGGKVATGSYDQTARVWDAATGRQLLLLKGPECDFNAAHFSRDGRRIITALGDGTTAIWSAEDGKLLVVLRGHEQELFDANFSPDGRRAITASADQTARLWDAETGGALAVLRGHTAPVLAASFSPAGGAVVLTAGFDNTARLWDPGSGAELRSFKGHRNHVYAAEFSADGRSIITASEDYTARIWDAGTGLELWTLRGHSQELLCASLSPDGKWAATGALGTAAKIWSLEPADGAAVLKGHGAPVHSACFSPEGGRVLTSSWDQTARIWDAREHRELLALRGHEKRVYWAEFSPDGRKAVTSSEDRTCRIWDAGTGKELLALRGHGDLVFMAGFSPDGGRILSAAGDKTAKIWEASSGRELLTLTGHQGKVFAARFSPDGHRAATAFWDRTARIWDAADGKPLLTFSGHSEAVLGVAFSPSGREAATCSMDGLAIFWNASTGAPIRTFNCRKVWIYGAHFSPDGKILLTCLNDGTARIWQVETGEEILALKGHGGSISGGGFSPDGRRVATASFDATARIWTVEPVETAKQRRPRELTAEERELYDIGMPQEK